jgi:hypothetical protein
MASGTDGEFVLNANEIWRCGDDLVPDVLEWIYFLGWLHIAQLQCPKTSGKKGEQDA